MDRSLDTLSSAFYPKACEVLARILARGVAVMIIQTSRTPAEHAANLRQGTSSVGLSKHLPRRLRGFPLSDPDVEKCDALDVAPYEQYQLHGPDKLKWAAEDPAWLVIIEEAERVGLRSGGRWLQPYDPGHMELVFPGDELRLASERQRHWPPWKERDV